MRFEDVEVLLFFALVTWIGTSFRSSALGYAVGISVPATIGLRPTGDLCRLRSLSQSVQRVAPGVYVFGGYGRVVIQLIGGDGLSLPATSEI